MLCGPTIAWHGFTFKRKTRKPKKKKKKREKKRKANQQKIKQNKKQKHNKKQKQNKNKTNKQTTNIKYDCSTSFLTDLTLSWSLIFSFFIFYQIVLGFNLFDLLVQLF